MATHFALCDRPESGGYNRGPVMRYLVGFLRVCGLVLIAFIACIDFGGGDDDGQACGLGENKCKDVVCDDDGNECTRDCNPATGRCDYSPVYDGRECDFDGLPGVCIFGVCEEDSCAGVVCDDGDECTQDVCDFRTGQCDYTVMYDGADCDFDGLAGVCTSGVCNQKYLCEGVDCDDGDECTQDVCIDATGTCDYAPAADGTACNGGLGLCADGVCDMLCVANFCRCSEAGIRAAIQAGGNQPYTFDCDGPKTVVTNSTIEIYNDVILNGEGNLTVDASDDHRVFAVGELVTVELRGFTVSGGKVVGEFGGGIANGGDLTLVNSTVRENAAESQPEPCGGDPCAAGRAGGIWNGGEGTLTLVSTTVSGNTADSGGGIFQSGATLMLTNSTASGNTASEGGGIYNDGSGPATLTNSTVSGNSAGSGSAILLSAVGPFASIITTATLIDGACTQQGEVTWTSGGYNIESPGNTCGFDQTGDQASVTTEQLNLGPLADNGGPTMTHALQTVPVVSAAIDQIPADACVDADDEPLTTDQRGEPRPAGAESKCDVGSFEVQPADFI